MIMALIMMLMLIMVLMMMMKTMILLPYTPDQDAESALKELMPH